MLPMPPTNVSKPASGLLSWVSAGDDQSVRRARAASKMEASARPSSAMTTARTMHMAKGSCTGTDPRLRASFQPPPAMKPSLYTQGPRRLLKRGREHVPHVLGVLQRAARTERNTGQRVVRDRHRQTGLFAQYLIEIGEQRAAAGEHDALVDDV